MFTNSLMLKRNFGPFFWKLTSINVFFLFHNRLLKLLLVVKSGNKSHKYVNIYAADTFVPGLQQIKFFSFCFSSYLQMSFLQIFITLHCTCLQKSYDREQEIYNLNFHSQLFRRVCQFYADDGFHVFNL